MEQLLLLLTGLLANLAAVPACQKQLLASPVLLAATLAACAAPSRHPQGGNRHQTGEGAISTLPSPHGGGAGPHSAGFVDPSGLLMPGGNATGGLERGSTRGGALRLPSRGTRRSHAVPYTRIQVAALGTLANLLGAGSADGAAGPSSSNGEHHGDAAATGTDRQASATLAGARSLSLKVSVAASGSGDLRETPFAGAQDAAQLAVQEAAAAAHGPRNTLALDDLMNALQSDDVSSASLAPAAVAQAGDPSSGGASRAAAVEGGGHAVAVAAAAAQPDEELLHGREVRGGFGWGAGFGAGGRSGERPATTRRPCPSLVSRAGAPGDAARASKHAPGAGPPGHADERRQRRRHGRAAHGGLGAAPDGPSDGFGPGAPELGDCDDWCVQESVSACIQTWVSSHGKLAAVQKRRQEWTTAGGCLGPGAATQRSNARGQPPTQLDNNSAAQLPPQPCPAHSRVRAITSSLVFGSEGG